VNAPGQLVTTRQVDLTLDVSGRLAEVPVRPGDSVQEGDVLARLETGPLEQAVAQADLNVRLAQLDLAAAREGPSEAELAAARAAVRDAKVELEVARHAYSATLNSALDSAVRSRKIEFDWSPRSIPPSTPPCVPVRSNSTGTLAIIKGEKRSTRQATSAKATMTTR